MGVIFQTSKDLDTLFVWGSLKQSNSKIVFLKYYWLRQVKNK